MMMVLVMMMMMVMVRKERESVPACKAAGGNWAVPASSTESSCTGSCQPRRASNALKVHANYFPVWETIPMHLAVSKWVILLVLLHLVLSTKRRRPPPMHSNPIISQDQGNDILSNRSEVVVMPRTVLYQVLVQDSKRTLQSSAIGQK